MIYNKKTLLISKVKKIIKLVGTTENPKCIDVVCSMRLREIAGELKVIINQLEKKK